MRVKAIDLFCGAGGLTRGLLDAGVAVKAGIDIDTTLKDTYEWNNRPARFMAADIRKLSARSLLDLVGEHRSEEILLAGCAPCQTFSKQRRDRPKSHPDSTLLGEFGRIVEAILPGWVLVENVPGLAKVPGFSTFRRFQKMLSARGYAVAQGVLNAADFGVPQHRRRYVMLASRVGIPMLPPKLKAHATETHNTVRGWISHYPPIQAGEEHPTVPNHVASPLSDLNLRRLRCTPSDGGDRRSWPEDLILECHKRGGKGFSDVYGRMWWDRVAPTLTGKCSSISNGRFGHPEQDRAMSLREAASLQTFPDHYIFYGLRCHIAQQIGNAVPPVLARALGEAVLGSSNAS